MISRRILPSLRESLTYFPVLSLTGPRQSGKTTLLRSEFPEYTYLSLEDPEIREYAETDPVGFLAQYRERVIIDEAQKVPHLFNYLQGVVDDTNQPGQYILSGSQNFLLNKHITQSLAGRVAVHRLLPLDLPELQSAGMLSNQWETTAIKGAYPRIFDVGIPHDQYYPSYLDTYVTRDIEEIINIRNVNLFRTFVKLCAGRIGQILNLSSLATDVGINQSTAREWLTLLESSYLVFTLSPYHRNFSKRLIKRPKLYFYDTGLVASLLGIKTSEQLLTHYLRGNLFENLIISDSIKQAYHQGSRPSCYFWRDSNGNEVDLLIDHAGKLDLIEIKSGKTINKDFFKGFQYMEKFASEVIESKTVIYGGTEVQTRTSAQTLPWNGWF